MRRKLHCLMLRKREYTICPPIVVRPESGYRCLKTNIRPVNNDDDIQTNNWWNNGLAHNLALRI